MTIRTHKTKTATLCRLSGVSLLTLMAVTLNIALAKDDQRPASAPTSGQGNAQALDAIALLAEAKLPAEPMIEKVENGVINWTHGKAIARGEGKAAGTSAQQVEMAQRAARLAAARNAILLMGNIRVSGSGRFLDISHANIQVDAVLQGFEEVSASFDPRTRTASVELAVPLYGAKGVIRLWGAKLPATLPASPGENQTQPDQQAAASVIVIDARSTDLKPCLLPRIVKDKTAEVLFAPSAAGLDDHPTAIYVTLPPTDRKAGNADDVLKALPPRALVLRAKTPDDKMPGAIVLDAEQSAKLQANGDAPRLLTQGRMIIVTSSPAKP